MTETQERILKYFKLQYIQYGKTYPAISLKDQKKYDLYPMWDHDMYYKIGMTYYFGKLWGELAGKEMFTYEIMSTTNTMPDHLIELFDKI